MNALCLKQHSFKGGLGLWRNKLVSQPVLPPRGERSAHARQLKSSEPQRGAGGPTAAVNSQLEAAFPQRSTRNQDFLSTAPGPLGFHLGLVQAIRDEADENHDETKQESLLASSSVLLATSRPVVTVPRQVMRQSLPRDRTPGRPDPKLRRFSPVSFLPSNPWPCSCLAAQSYPYLSHFNFISHFEIKQLWQRTEKLFRILINQNQSMKCFLGTPTLTENLLSGKQAQVSNLDFFKNSFQNLVWES